MKVALASDLHLEFGTIELHNTEGADVLILSGDICVASELRDWDSYDVVGENVRSQVFHKFFQQVCMEFKHVIYIMGNHEHYHGDYVTTYNRLRSKLSYLKNLFILNNSTVEIDDTVFFGGTLWTDMNKEDPVTMFSLRDMMNDFRIVDNSKYIYSSPFGKIGPARLMPEDVVLEHKQFLVLLKLHIRLYDGKDFVVVGHHAPSKQSTHPRYTDEIMNGGYSSDLSEFILDNPRIKLWTHGHTHEVFDYMVGSTRIACNPRGYDNHEQRAKDFELKFLEIA